MLSLRGSPPRLLLGSPGSLKAELWTGLLSGLEALRDGPHYSQRREANSDLLGLNLRSARCQPTSSEGSYLPESAHVSPGRKEAVVKTVLEITACRAFSKPFIQESA